MTVVDTSAVFAILFQEPEADTYEEAVERSRDLHVSAATLVEMGVVALGRGGPPLLAELEAMLEDAIVEVVPLTGSQARRAIAGFARYGRGIGRPRCLNFGDCFSYALAKELDEPLLYKGSDFSQTDVRSALKPT